MAISQVEEGREITEKLLLGLWASDWVPWALQSPRLGARGKSPHAFKKPGVRDTEGPWAGWGKRGKKEEKTYEDKWVQEVLAHSKPTTSSKTWWNAASTSDP